LLQEELDLRQTFQDGLMPNIRVPISRRIQREHWRLKINITRVQLVVHLEERIADVAVVLVEQRLVDQASLDQSERDGQQQDRRPSASC
jgi:hypothetical protein